MMINNLYVVCIVAPILIYLPIENMNTKHDNHHYESKTRTHRFSKLPDDGDPLAPNYLLKSGAKEKHQLNPVGPSNRQEAPVTGLNQLK